MTRYLSLWVGAGLALGTFAAPALAGPCAQQLTELHKLMSAQDAGSGPVATTANSGQGATNQTNAIAGQPGAGNTVSNKAMNDATKLKAASEQDVRRQQEGQPTASQQASGAVTSDSADRQGRIDEAVKRADVLDNQNDGGCSAAIEEARQLLQSHQTQ